MTIAAYLSVCVCARVRVGDARLATQASVNSARAVQPVCLLERADRREPINQARRVGADRRTKISVLAHKFVLMQSTMFATNCTNSSEFCSHTDSTWTLQAARGVR